MRYRSRNATAQAAAQVAVLATEAAGEALASGASDPAVILAGKAVAAMSRMQRRLIERHGVVHAACLMRSILEHECDLIITHTDDELIDEIGNWGNGKPEPVQ